MLKHELISILADSLGENEELIKKILDTMLIQIKDELSKGNNVSFPEFGTLRIQKQHSNSANKVIFVAGRDLNKLINQNNS